MRRKSRAGINRPYAAIFAAYKIESRLHRGWASKSMSLSFSAVPLDIFLIGASRALSDGASQCPGRCACPLHASALNSLAHRRPIIDPAPVVTGEILISRGLLPTCWNIWALNWRSFRRRHPQNSYPFIKRKFIIPHYRPHTHSCLYYQLYHDFAPKWQPLPLLLPGFPSPLRLGSPPPFPPGQAPKMPNRVEVLAQPTVPSTLYCDL
jgi:hypothetical protein